MLHVYIPFKGEHFSVKWCVCISQAVCRVYVYMLMSVCLTFHSFLASQHLPEVSALLRVFIECSVFLLYHTSCGGMATKLLLVEDPHHHIRALERERERGGGGGGGGGGEGRGEDRHKVRKQLIGEYLYSNLLYTKDSQH